MDRKEKILSYIQSKEYIPLKADEMALVLDVPKNDKQEFVDILESLCGDGEIYRTQKGRYIPVDNRSRTASGRLVCNARGYFGFVECDGDDIFVSGDDMGGALNSDKVLVRFRDGREGGKREGYVIRVLERGNDVVTGIIYKEKNGYFCLRPDNRQIYTKISIAPDKMMNAQIGDRVSVLITKYSDSGKIFGEVMAVLGDKDDIKGFIEGIITENHIKQEFNEETLAEALTIPEAVTDAGDREDLRDTLVFTIDGDDARDFDDAVSLETSDSGNYLLGVHIADVSEYVCYNSALDKEAYERGTSVYLADRVIPMLPERLSNGICSLNPNADRLTLSVFMEIDGDGNVVSHRLSKSVIRSKERMTYNNVNLILERADAALCEKYKHLLPTLAKMNELALILNKKRVNRGAIQFDFPESRIKVNEKGEPVEIEREIRGASNKMIEEFMLAANETIAEYAFWTELPFIYRNHEAPSEDKIAAFNSLLMHFGMTLKGKIDKDNPVKPKALQQILDKVTDTPEERIISRNMLQSLMKARYSDECLGHFGLAAKYYCHFTSPIRRYPDLIVHRILKMALDGELDENTVNQLRAFVPSAASQSTDCEINAECTEREIDDLMKTAYMSALAGETFEGTVSGVAGYGMFVELENSVEGLVRVENMNGDYYEYDENTSSLIGRRKKRVYTIGDSVKVVTVHTDLALRQIDFVLERDYSDRLIDKLNKKPALNGSKKEKRARIKHRRRKKY